MGRVVVTGLGVVTPLGIGWQDMWDGLVHGRSGVSRLQLPVDDLPTRIGAQVRDFDPAAYLDRREARRMDRFSQFAVVAADLALRDAGLDPARVAPEAAGITVGTGIGGIGTFCEQHEVLLTRGPDRVSPLFIPMMSGNMAAARLAIRYGWRGPNLTTVTACTSSAQAVGEALRVLQRGEAEVMLAGGTEAAIHRLSLAGFCAMKALSTRNEDPEGACRPFDRGRDGFVLGEGAAVLVLETEEHARRRGARPYAAVVGYGTSADAYHVVEPHPEGLGAGEAMVRALRDAGIRPEEVDYINAHATGTPKGDVGEALAIRRVFGEHARRLPVSATKSMTGHLLGAAGAVEAVITVLALYHQVVPPTRNLHDPDPACDLAHVTPQALPHPMRRALSNSFAFGGQNAALVFEVAP